MQYKQGLKPIALIVNSATYISQTKNLRQILQKQKCKAFALPLQASHFEGPEKLHFQQRPTPKARALR